MTAYQARRVRRALDAHLGITRRPLTGSDPWRESGMTLGVAERRAAGGSAVGRARVRPLRLVRP
jgi:hypothetical protein